VVEAPFGFLEVVVEEIPSHTPQLRQAELGEAPERFDAVDVLLAPGELVAMMMDAVVLVALGHQPVVGAPSVGVDRALLLEDLSPDDAH